MGIATMDSLSERISDKDFVPRKFRSVVWAKSLVDPPVFSTLMTETMRLQSFVRIYNDEHITHYALFTFDSYYMLKCNTV